MLPELPINKGKRRRQIVEFRGLNLTENTREGEFRDTLGLSSEGYPLITQMVPRTEIEGYAAPHDLYEWDGHLVFVSDGILYYDYEALDNVNAEPKQYAVVNTKLIIWPDKTYIDLTNGEYVKLDASVAPTGAGTFTLTSSSITSVLEPKLKEDTLLAPIFGGYVDRWTPTLYTYGKDKSAVEACWNSSTQEWNLAALGELETLKSVWSDYWSRVPVITAGDIIIPSVSGNSYSMVSGFNDADASNPPNRDYLGSQPGYYAQYVRWDGIIGAYPYACRQNMYYDVYKVGMHNRLFSDVFEPGQWVQLSTEPEGLLISEPVKISAIDDTTNTVTFESEIYEGETAPTLTSFRVTRAMPDLDYICERNNRLWGVNNRDRVIRCSALGEPWDFWTMGTDAGAWAVAVGSEGEFTGICDYGGAVCCWKEGYLHRVLGEYPSEFYISDFRVTGVQKDYHRSMCIINEVLYYRSPYGIYAYGGSTPGLISYNLGTGRLTEAVGGTDGRRYYVSAYNEDGDGVLYSYDLTHGIWMKEENRYCDSMTYCEGVFYYTAEGKLFKLDKTGETGEWLAELVAIDETEHIHKYYSKLDLRFDFDAGSSLRLDISEDRGAYHTVWENTEERDLTKMIPIAIKRCDRLRIRLSGTGRVTVRSITREYTEGSDKD